jgi:hypothetical protein
MHKILLKKKSIDPNRARNSDQFKSVPWKGIKTTNNNIKDNGGKFECKDSFFKIGYGTLPEKPPQGAEDAYKDRLRKFKKKRSMSLD